MTVKPTALVWLALSAIIVVSATTAEIISALPRGPNILLCVPLTTIGAVWMMREGKGWLLAAVRCEPTSNECVIS